MERCHYDLVVIGGGVVGVSFCRAISRNYPGLKVLLIEKEDGLAKHQSGRNSGVVHAGYNQVPGTMKARFVVDGSVRLLEFCRENGVDFRQDGICVVAADEADLPILETLLARGIANGANVRMLDRKELRIKEPACQGLAALYASSGASFDASAFVAALGKQAIDLGVVVSKGEELVWAEEKDRTVELITSKRRILAKFLVAAAGLQADRIARMFGLAKDLRVIPFRGDYRILRRERSALVRSHIYPCPDLRFPFLGAHFSRNIDDRVLVGPGALPALGRECYRRNELCLPDILDSLAFPGVRKLWGSQSMQRLLLREIGNSLFRECLANEGRRLLPDLQASDLEPGPCGIRAQLISSRGELLDDLEIETSARSLHVLNAVSPALTCSLPFADYLVYRVGEFL